MNDQLIEERGLVLLRSIGCTLDRWRANQVLVLRVLAETMPLSNPFRRSPSQAAIAEAEPDIVPSESRNALRVLFFSANTGGGHKASAESLIKQFEIHFPGSEAKIYNMEDVMDTWPYVKIAENYQELTQKPSRWRVIYHTSNHPVVESVIDWHSTRRCQSIYEKLIEEYQPDVIISVHPALNFVPLQAARTQPKHIPFFTVVTDLGSGHFTWFQKDVDRLYVASERLRDLALSRKRIDAEKTVLAGLPIRNEFAVMAKEMGIMQMGQEEEEDAGQKEVNDSTLLEFQLQQKRNVKRQLDLNDTQHMVLVMGGGEGVGSLTDIVEEIYADFVKENISATVCVVCGKNAELKEKFEKTDWDQVLESKTPRPRFSLPTLPSLPSLPGLLRRNGTKEDNGSDDNNKDDNTPPEPPPPPPPPQGNVTVVPLGFVTQMAEYMAAASVLVTKAGPGTIAEAAALGLPVLLTSFLPGQEAGNVDFVCDKGFGKYLQSPSAIAQELITWMKDPTILQEMSAKSRQVGHPHAAKEIVLDIGSRAHAWKERNEKIEAAVEPKEGKSLEQNGDVEPKQEEGEGLEQQNGDEEDQHKDSKDPGQEQGDKEGQEKDAEGAE